MQSFYDPALPCKTRRTVHAWRSCPYGFWMFPRPWAYLFRSPFCSVDLRSMCLSLCQRHSVSIRSCKRELSVLFCFVLEWPKEVVQCGGYGMTDGLTDGLIFQFHGTVHHSYLPCLKHTHSLTVLQCTDRCTGT